MTFFYVIGAFVYFTFRAYEEISGKEYSSNDEFRMMIVTGCIIIVVIDVLAGLICVAAGAWNGIVAVLCIVIALDFGAIAYLVHY